MTNKLTEMQQMAFLTAYNSIMLHTVLRRSGVADGKTQFACISGYAGTGKSAVISTLWSELVIAETRYGIRGCVTSFTGRACENLNERGVPCSTSHSLFYEPVLDHNGNLLYFKQKDVQTIRDEIGDYVIVEEASMMPLDLISKVLDTGAFVLFVGDDEQLDCIDGESVFTAISNQSEKYAHLFDNMPIIFLEEVKRTADGSSINLFAQDIRTTGRLSFKSAGNDVKKLRKKDFNMKWLRENWKDWDVIICGTNRTRAKYNMLVRAAIGKTSEYPEPGDRVVCLSNSVVAGSKINNGELFEVLTSYIGDKTSQFQIQKIGADMQKCGPLLTVQVDNNMWDESVRSPENFGNRNLHDFTFGYALTCHKMQGSSMPNVIFYDEDVSFFIDQKRFRYTGCTRPSESLLVVVP